MGGGSSKPEGDGEEYEQPDQQQAATERRPTRPSADGRKPRRVSAALKGKGEGQFLRRSDLDAGAERKFARSKSTMQREQARVGFDFSKVMNPEEKSDEELLYVKRMFEAADKDGNGEIDLEEFLAHFKTQAKPGCAPFVKRLFFILDMDAGGDISFREFVFGLAQFDTGEGEGEAVEGQVAFLLALFERKIGSGRAVVQQIRESIEEMAQAWGVPSWEALKAREDEAARARKKAGKGGKGVMSSAPSLDKTMGLYREVRILLHEEPRLQGEASLGLDEFAYLVEYYGAAFAPAISVWNRLRPYVPLCRQLVARVDAIPGQEVVFGEMKEKRERIKVLAQEAALMAQYLAGTTGVYQKPRVGKIVAGMSPAKQRWVRASKKAIFVWRLGSSASRVKDIAAHQQEEDKKALWEKYAAGKARTRAWAGARSLTTSSQRHLSEALANNDAEGAVRHLSEQQGVSPAVASTLADLIIPEAMEEQKSAKNYGRSGSIRDRLRDPGSSESMSPMSPLGQSPTMVQGSPSKMVRALRNDAGGAGASSKVYQQRAPTMLGDEEKVFRRTSSLERRPGSFASPGTPNSPVYISPSSNSADNSFASSMGGSRFKKGGNNPWNSANTVVLPEGVGGGGGMSPDDGDFSEHSPRSPVTVVAGVVAGPADKALSNMAVARRQTRNGKALKKGLSAVMAANAIKAAGGPAKAAGGEGGAAGGTGRAMVDRSVRKQSHIDQLHGDKRKKHSTMGGGLDAAYRKAENSNHPLAGAHTYLRSRNDRSDEGNDEYQPSGPALSAESSLPSLGRPPSMARRTSGAGKQLVRPSRPQSQSRAGAGGARGPLAAEASMPELARGGGAEGGGFFAKMGAKMDGLMRSKTPAAKGGAKYLSPISK
mmetsp:Transcript_64696/g.204251  ORF Transcript_64696/g.204251 Transcript_64696/m.204251 type:complete len:882 (-) Transcript_64696:163-2808(-)